MGLGRQKLLEPEPHQVARRARIGPSCTLQEVQEGREEAVAALVGVKEAPDKDGVLSAHRALPGQERACAGSLAPGKPLAAQSVESHHGRLPLPANRVLLAVEFLGSSYRLKPAHRVSYRLEAQNLNKF